MNTTTTRRAEPNDLPGILAFYRELKPHDPDLAPEVAQAAFRALATRSDIHVVVCAWQKGARFDLRCPWKPHQTAIRSPLAREAA